MVEDGKILLQVLPVNTRNSPGKDGPFRIYTFPDKPTVASAEHMTGEVVIDDAARLQQCEVIYGSLQASALGAAESLEVVLKAREKFNER
ncbi:Scr1 family TA system antitoxin-like transcriptional regulator [Nocardiopsis alba]|uniref:Scr1 family TA system antitoxin-like transcriptional regulator n=1 Tax=Nocardiopsis alba TaxID=53437 RepID=UPI00381C63FE